MELVIELLGGEGLGGEDLRRKIYNRFRFRTDLYNILNRAAQFIIRNGLAILGHGKLEGMIAHLKGHIKGFTIQHGGQPGDGLIQLPAVPIQTAVVAGIFSEERFQIGEASRAVAFSVLKNIGGFRHAVITGFRGDT